MAKIQINVSALYRFNSWPALVVPGIGVLFTLLLLSGCAQQEIQSLESDFQQIYKSQTIEETNYLLGPADTIKIRSIRRKELNLDVQLDPNGHFQYPHIGDVNAKGLSTAQLASLLTEKLAEYYRNPQLQINLESSESQNIYVTGEVKRPGKFAVTGSINLMKAIAAAGGYTYDAKLEQVFFIRTSTTPPLAATINLKEIYEENSPVPDWLNETNLIAGDIVHIPASTIANVERLFERINNITNTYRVR